MSAIDRLRAIASRDPADRMARELLDVIEAAANLVGELDEDVKTWGEDHLPESTEDARQATADALSRAGNSQSRGDA